MPRDTAAKAPGSINRRNDLQPVQVKATRAEDQTLRSAAEPLRGRVRRLLRGRHPRFHEQSTDRPWRALLVPVLSPSRWPVECIQFSRSVCNDVNTAHDWKLQ